MVVWLGWGKSELAFTASKIQWRYEPVAYELWALQFECNSGVLPASEVRWKLFIQLFTIQLCLHSSSFILTAVPPTAPTAEYQCSDGEINYADKCFVLGEDRKLSWADAQFSCQRVDIIILLCITNHLPYKPIHTMCLHQLVDGTGWYCMPVDDCHRFPDHFVWQSHFCSTCLVSKLFQLLL